jgi:hypothetical protein
MAATMTVGLHENRNENLHGGDKSRNSLAFQETPGQSATVWND